MTITKVLFFGCFVGLLGFVLGYFPTKAETNENLENATINSN